MTTATINRLRAVFTEELGAMPALFEADTRITELAPDSLEQLDLLLAIEEAFGIELADDAIENAQTVNDLATLIDRLTDSAGVAA